jgi:hypothetical protein
MLYVCILVCVASFFGSLLVECSCWVGMQKKKRKSNSLTLIRALYLYIQGFQTCRQALCRVMEQHTQIESNHDTNLMDPIRSGKRLISALVEADTTVSKRCKFEAVGPSKTPGLTNMLDHLLDLVCDQLAEGDQNKLGCLCSSPALFSGTYTRHHNWSQFNLERMSRQKYDEVIPNVRKLTTVNAVNGRVPLWLRANYPLLSLLKFSQYFNAPLLQGELPDKIRYMDMGRSFNQPLYPGVLGTALLELRLGDAFNQPFAEDVLPSSLKRLYIGNGFSQRIDQHALPGGLLFLSLGNSFNGMLRLGAGNLLELVIADGFNQRFVEGDLPLTLKRLQIGDGFNQPIGCKMLPKWLESLQLGDAFNQDLLLDTLPNSLISLQLGVNFNREICLRVLPQSLETLAIGEGFSQRIEAGVLPSGLRSLRMYGSPLNILQNDVLPPTLRQLTLYGLFNQQILKGTLPDQLRELSLGDHFNQPLVPHGLPVRLDELYLPDCFNQPLVQNALPPHLSRLKLGSSFNQPINVDVLPARLHWLHFERNFDQALVKGVLPATLRHLRLGARFNQRLDAGALPESLQVLELRKCTVLDMHTIAYEDLPSNGPVGLHFLPALLRGKRSGDVVEIVRAIEHRLPRMLQCIKTHGLSIMLRR